MAIMYHSIPTIETWKRDSSVLMARRSDDKILQEIDYLIDFYAMDGFDELSQQQIEYARNDIVCDLFFALDYWLKVFRTTAGMDKGREPSISALYRYTAEHLCRIFNCTINVLPMRLEKYFGRSLAVHGSYIDTVQNVAKYLKRAEAAAFKLHFENGIAKRWQNGKLVLAQSRDCSVAFDNWANFAMSMGRDIYMALHTLKPGTGHQDNFYHSSYLAGGPVLCAGSIWIDNGVVKGIRNDSGHYQPETSHLVNVLRTLRMHGVALDNVKVENHEGFPTNTTADVFLDNGGSWAQVLERGRMNLDSTNAVNAKHADLEKTIVRLWKDGVRQGTWQNDDEGMMFFVGIFLQSWTNSSGKVPFAGVRSDYVLTAIGRERSGRKQKMNQELLAEWDKYLKDTKAPNSEATIMPFVVAIKMKRSRAFHKWPDVALADHIRFLLKEKGHRFG